MVQNNAPYPLLNELRRVSVSYHNSKVTLISWSLCDYERDHINLRGVIADSFHHDTGTAFKNIAKKWRQNRNDRHRDVSAFSQQVFNDNKYDLSSTVQVLRHALVPPQSVACIQKIINKSLYMG